MVLSDSYSSNGVLSCPIMLLAFTKSKSLQIHHTISWAQVLPIYYEILVKQ